MSVYMNKFKSFEEWKKSRIAMIMDGDRQRMPPDKAAWDYQQAIIDEIMLEYCPDEMTPQQIEEWGRNQRPVDDETNKQFDRAVNKL